jgi:predicted nucleic acid-binding Zn ribbon protein
VNRKQSKVPCPAAPPANSELADAIADVQRTREQQHCFPRPRPKRMGDLVARLLAKRGYAQIQAAGEVVAAWQAAVGAKLAAHTRVGALKTGTLNVIVASTGLLQELLFQKDDLLTRINKQLHSTTIKKLHLRTGNVTGEP